MTREILLPLLLPCSSSTRSTVQNYSIRYTVTWKKYSILRKCTVQFVINS